MHYFSRRMIKPSDLNAGNTLFGGTLLKWIDEEASIFVMSQVGNTRVVTKYMSEINFVHSAVQGEIVEIGLELSRIGRTSVSLRCQVRTLLTKNTIIEIDQIVFVHLDDNRRPTPHLLDPKLVP